MTCRSNAATQSPPPGAACRCAPEDAVRGLPERQFAAMLGSYGHSGGLVRADEALALFRFEHGPDVALLARWIVARQVVSFYWHAETWLPLFQFRRSDMSVRAELRPVFAELNSVFDRWELATWFAWPNTALADRAPAQVLASDPVAVLEAARLDRFVAIR